MRDILVTLLVFGSLPFILMRPYIGVLVWSWLSYMNPHRLTWGFAYDMPFAQIVAVTLLVAILFSKEKKGFPVNGTTVIWLIFIFWMGVTTALAVYPDFAFDYYLRILKIQVITFFTMMLMTNQRRIDLLIWVIVLSIGFYSVKGGLFTIYTGGGYRVWGPESSMIEDNNALALATLMILPLLYYLYKTTTDVRVRYILVFVLISSFASALGSQSRGGVLAMICVLGYLWLQSKKKVVTGIMVLLIAGIGFTLMPESWHERMDTIKNYEQDESAMGRINAWKYSINVANDRITGAGLESWAEETYAIYNPEATRVLVAHSIYFNVLADHGWIGLILFLAILGLTWKNLSYVCKQHDTASENQVILAKMLKISLVAYATGGAFLSLSYFDLPWHIIALAVLIRGQLPEKEMAVKKLMHPSSQALPYGAVGKR